MAGAAMSSAEAAKTIASTFAGKMVRVHIPDGRMFSGTFVCVDSDVNVILANTDEIQTSPSNGGETSRSVGMVMVPGEHIVKVEVRQDSAPAREPLRDVVTAWRPPDDEALYT